MTRTELKPLPGMPCTVCIGSDRYASSIVSVSASGKSLVLESGEKVRLKKNGAYRTTGRVGFRVWIGVAENYRDPSF